MHLFVNFRCHRVMPVCADLYYNISLLSLDLLHNLFASNKIEFISTFLFVFPATFPPEYLFSSPPASSSSTSSCHLCSLMEPMKIEWSKNVQLYVMGSFCVWHRNIFLWYAIGSLLYIFSEGRPLWLIAGRFSGMGWKSVWPRWIPQIITVITQ